MLRRYAKKTLRHLQTPNYQPLNRIELDRQRLLHNVAHVQQQHPSLEVIPVLKGNAYGHGIEPVATMLQGSTVKFLAVDGYFEAAKIREFCKQQLLVMGYILPANLHLLDTKRCSFVVQDTASLEAFGRLGKPVRVHLELNTGMNRLGLQPSELPVYLKTLQTYPNLQLEGVMTHLADADNELDESFTQTQLQNFDQQVAQILAAGFKPQLIHIAQTAGSTKAHSRYANALRLGIGAYGINPLAPSDPHHGDLAGLQPILELKSTIIKIIQLQTGDKVSYNGIFTAPGPMRIGVLPIGYYEGLPRDLSNKALLTHKTHQLPIVGRVCMNHTMIDLQDTNLKVGDEVTVISKHNTQPNSILGLQRLRGLFAYSTLTGISSSIRRQII